MQNYVVKLECPVPRSFRTQKAADSVALDISTKSTHTLAVTADLESEYHVGLIVGSSGSGKTTLAASIWGRDALADILDPERPVIDQFDSAMSYDECATALTGIGLTSIPCWVRPANTLSTGQRARAEAALRMARVDEITVVDEWTSVVDRTVARVMSHAIQKHARRSNKRVVLLACHRDIIEWLNPDWVIDCNNQTFVDRRNMVGAFERTDRLRLDIRECDRQTWGYFSKYHYLSDRLPGGKIHTFGLFNGDDQIGFQCFANYNMSNRNELHSNRVVIHPDFVGLGLGIAMATETSKIMHDRGYFIRAKFTSLAMFKQRINHPNWKCTAVKRNYTKRQNGITTPSRTVSKRDADSRNRSKLNYVTYYHFDFVREPVRR